MADRYNVDDILEEIKRKKSGSGSMISSRRAQDEDEAPVYSRYDQEPDEASSFPVHLTLSGGSCPDGYRKRTKVSKQP